MKDFGRVDLDLIAKYTPLQWYRSKGFSTQELGDMASKDRHLPKLLKRIDKAIREFLPTKDERYVREVLEGLDELARVHVYFWYKGNCRLDVPPEPFQFERQPLSFETVDGGTFTDVLYPDSIYGIVDFHLRECVKRETRLRVCKNCGRYFAI